MRQTFYEFCMLHEKTNLLKEWDESRNFPLTPDTVSYGSKKKVWWTCENGHSWQTTVHVRSEGSGCPYCTGRKVLPGFNDLETLYPDVAAQWDREKNGPLSPRRLHGLEDPHLVALSGGALVAVAHRLAHGVGARMPRVRGQDDRHG